MEAMGSDGNAKIREWTLEGGHLVRTEEFTDFRAAMLWVNRVACLAEQRNHHPDIDIRWNRVTLKLMTHETRGLTDRDWSWIQAAETQLVIDNR
ncbi:MAG: 4a-hydroxytetrahydrobiopterin dehydratase [Verrucomicrobia bacterium]|nr:4a-hydroxytetrahydrobiopterin dehydratase [Verrucomicrobiota bacterium]